MNCREVNELFGAYLDGEVTPSERMLIRTHLAGCDVCREKLAALSVTHSRVSRSLRARAARAALSPQAWSRLQARLAGEARPSRPWLTAWLQRLSPGGGGISQIFRGGITMKKGFSLAAMAVLVISVSTVVLSPSVRAQVGEILNVWIRFEAPGGEYGVALSGPGEFTPLTPTYLPAGLQSSGGGMSITETDGESESVKLRYYDDERFAAITQVKAPADKSLPTGREVSVNGQPARLVTGLEGTFEYGLRGIPLEGDFEYYDSRDPEDTSKDAQVKIRIPESVPHRGTIAYTDGKRLTWYSGDVKIEMLSNLSEAEMLKIAESLVPAEAIEGEPVFQVPLDLPLGSEGEPFVITQGGSTQGGPLDSNP